jgi:hypothetical protein
MSAPRCKQTHGSRASKNRVGRTLGVREEHEAIRRRRDDVVGVARRYRKLTQRCLRVGAHVAHPHERIVSHVNLRRLQRGRGHGGPARGAAAGASTAAAWRKHPSTAAGASPSSVHVHTLCASAVARSRSGVRSALRLCAQQQRVKATQLPRGERRVSFLFKRAMLDGHFFVAKQRCPVRLTVAATAPQARHTRHAGDEVRSVERAGRPAWCSITAAAAAVQARTTSQQAEQCSSAHHRALAAAHAHCVQQKRAGRASARQCHARCETHASHSALRQK